MEPSRVPVKQEAVTVAKDGGSGRDPVVGVGVVAMEVELAEDLRVQGGVGEEGRVSETIVHEDDAAHRVWQELREQQPAAIDDGAPRLAHAPRGGEAARREAAEDFPEGVLGQRQALRISISFHRPGSQIRWE